MVIVMSAAAGQADITHVLERLAERSCRGELTVGVERTIITVVGPKPPALADDVRALPHVDNVVLLGKSYELAGRETKPAGSVVHVGNVAIGGDALALIAGPGTVESEEQVVGLARSLREAGAQLLAGGAMRPDQSPYAFRGLGEEGLRHLAAARAATGLPVISDVSSTSDVEIVARYADALEVGPFHMRNFGLLEAVPPAASRCCCGGRSRRPWMNGCSARSTSSTAATTRSSCARPGFVPLSPPHPPLPTLAPFPSSSRGPTCRSSWIPPAAPGAPRWWSRWRWRPWPRRRTG